MFVFFSFEPELLDLVTIAQFQSLHAVSHVPKLSAGDGYTLPGLFSEQAPDPEYHKDINKAYVNQKKIYHR